MRLVSLVPSLTETLIGLGAGPERLVGRSAFCVAPADRVEEIRVVGGTKTPSLKRILALEPDLVLMDREENRVEDAEALRAAGIAIHDVLVEGPASVPAMLRELGGVVGLEQRAEAEARALEEELARLPSGRAALSALVLIWKGPYMAIGRERYGARILRVLGVETPAPGEGPYPEVDGARMAGLSVDLVVLPDEPYAFTEAEGKEIADAIEACGAKRPRILHVNGQDLLWYGTRTRRALRRLAECIPF